jgi:hypothetical protein
MAFDQGRNMLWTWKSAWNKTRTILVANEGLSSDLIWYTLNRMHTLIVKISYYKPEGRGFETQWADCVGNVEWGLDVSHACGLLRPVTGIASL